MGKRRRPQTEQLPGPWREAAFDPDARKAVKRRKPRPPVTNETATAIAKAALASDASRITEPLKKGATHCPKCYRRTDEYRRCWHCSEWVCDCGGLTGSPYISCCQPCVLKAEEGVSERKRVLAAWVDRVKARAS